MNQKLFKMDNLQLLKDKIDVLQERLSQQTLEYKKAIRNDIFSEAKKLYVHARMTVRQISAIVEKMNKFSSAAPVECEEKLQNSNIMV